MEDKRSLGEYIAEHRRALGLTQRQFAERLYVTDSAVSKWERGLSYPDITLLHDICAVLGVTEHELLTASEDTEARRAGALRREGALSPAGAERVGGAAAGREGSPALRRAAARHHRGAGRGLLPRRRCRRRRDHRQGSIKTKNAPPAFLP